MPLNNGLYSLEAIRYDFAPHASGNWATAWLVLSGETFVEYDIDDLFNRVEWAIDSTNSLPQPLKRLDAELTTGEVGQDEAAELVRFINSRNVQS